MMTYVSKSYKQTLVVNQFTHNSTCISSEWGQLCLTNFSWPSQIVS